MKLQPASRTQQIQAVKQNIYNDAKHQPKPENSAVDNIITHTELGKTLLELEKSLEFLNRRFDFRIHEDTGALVVAIIDRETDKIVRTVPPEYLLDVTAKVREFVGLIIDERL